MSIEPHVDASADMAYFVLDADDRVIQVGRDLHDQLGPFLGHVLWEHMPDAEPLYAPGFAEARRVGEAVEFPAFYRGRAKRLRAVPAGDTLAVHVERVLELDATTLGTLSESLRQIEAALADRASEPHDLRVPASLQALP